MKKFVIIGAVVVLAALAGYYFYNANSYVTEYVLTTLKDGKLEFKILEYEYESNEAAIAAQKKAAQTEDDMWLRHIDEENEKADKGGDVEKMKAKYMVEAYMKNLNRDAALFCIRHNKFFDADDLAALCDEHGAFSPEMLKALEKAGVTYRAAVVHEPVMRPAGEFDNYASPIPLNGDYAPAEDPEMGTIEP